MGKITFQAKELQETLLNIDKSSIVRILKKDSDETIGTGFLINQQGCFLTCYHVIEPFLDYNENNEVKPFMIKVMFTNVENNEKNELQAVLDTDLTTKQAQQNDLAFLKIDEEKVPKAVTPVRFRSTKNVTNYVFSTWGYGGSTQEAGAPQNGTIISTTDHFRNADDDTKMPVIHLDGGDITPGYSGSPVFAAPNLSSTHLHVVGMIIEAEFTLLNLSKLVNSGDYVLKSARSFAVPTEIIKNYQKDIIIDEPLDINWLKYIGIGTNFVAFGSFVFLGIVSIFSVIFGLEPSFSDFMVDIIMLIGLLFLCFPILWFAKRGKYLLTILLLSLLGGLIFFHIYNNVTVYRPEIVELEVQNHRLSSCTAVNLPYNFEVVLNLTFENDRLFPSAITEITENLQKWPSICSIVPQNLQNPQIESLVNSSQSSFGLKVGYYGVNNCRMNTIFGSEQDTSIELPLVTIRDRSGRNLVQIELTREDMCGEKNKD